MNVLLIGAPGVGKGTISRYLISNYGLDHISTGDILREAVVNKTELGLKVKEYMDKGALVSDEIIIGIIRERLSKCKSSNGYIFDGFPRTNTQAIAFESILKELNLKIDVVLVLDVEDDIVIKRITGRRTCPKCNTIYNIYYSSPKTQNVCDKCGCELFTRNDDNLESLKKRLSEYHTNADSLIHYYDELKLVKHIDASKTREEEYVLLVKILEGLK